MLPNRALPSTRQLDLFPDIPTLLRIIRAAALLDAILSPEWSSRYFSFNADWAAGESMASMRDGQGDEWFLVFSDRGAILKGFAHESEMATDAPQHGVLFEVPPAFSGFLREEAFSMADTTFCIWQESGEDTWRIGNIDFPEAADPDGSEDLLFIFDGRPETYRDWAEDYFEMPVDLAIVEQIYRGEPLTRDMVQRLNPNLEWENLTDDLQEIGYPAVN